MRGTSRAAPERGGGVEVGDIIVGVAGEEVNSEAGARMDEYLVYLSICLSIYLSVCMHVCLSLF